MQAASPDLATALVQNAQGIITAFAALVSALGIAFVGIMTVINGRNIRKVITSTNGMKAELVAEVRAAALATGNATGETRGHAAGLEQGRHEEREAK